MLPLLTKYLLRYKTVCIPHVGTFEIVQQPPQLNVADKEFNPPVFRTRFIQADAVPDHQFDFFASVEGGKEKVRTDLLAFGEKLVNKIKNSGFHWVGFGKLQYHSNQLVFDPEEIRLQSFQSIPSQKVLRENVQHQVLVGDQQMTSQEVTDVLTRVEYKRPWFMIAGWVIFMLALVAIIIILYLKNFQTGAAGMQTMF